MKSFLSGICMVAFSSAFIFGNCNKSNTTPSSENYSPSTTGSTWTYLNTPGGASTLTITTKDTVAAGKTYKVLSNSSGTNNYRAKIGGDYYRFGVVPTIGAGGVEELYLKDGQSVNSSWSATQTFSIQGYPGPATATFTYILKEKGIAKTVATKAYTNVTHVRLDITVALLGNIGGGDFYYANGIGLIDGLLTINVPGQPIVTQAQVLTSYDIK